MSTTYGGSNESQRNILARPVLDEIGHGQFESLQRLRRCLLALLSFIVGKKLRSNP
ncbi:MAG: hypothetical protein ACKVQQ_21945 [Burkholderiales bacterium]